MSIAVINAIGNLGGIVGPFLIGYVKGRGNSATTGLLFLAGLTDSSLAIPKPSVPDSAPLGKIPC